MLIFDFDGVLMDSMDEVAATGYNAVTGRCLTTLDAMSQTVVMRFRQNRCRVRTSDEIFVLMDWCVAMDGATSDTSRRNERLSRSEFEKFLAKSPLTPAERSTRFFAARKRFMETDRNAWLALHRPFQPIWHELAFRSKAPVILLTSKNRAAVIELCAHFGLGILPGNVYSGDGGTSKTTHLKAIHARFNCAPYRFIDDSLDNLRRLDADFNDHRRFVDLILAGWGYVGPGDAAEAEQLGYRVISRPSAASLIPKECR